MSLALRAAAVYLPGPVRRAALGELFAVTAAAFGRPPPDLDDLDDEELLASYAAFSAARAEAAIAAGEDLTGLARRLEAGAWAIGAGLRARLRLRPPGHPGSTADAMAAARLAYRAIGIDFAGTAGGQVTISRCRFAASYSPRVCRLLGALDAGLLAGLSGGARLTFSQRITEGAPCCLARLAPREAET